MCGDTVTVTLPATGHDYEVITTETDEVTAHTYNHLKCTVCGDETDETIHNDWVEGYYTDTVTSAAGCTSNVLRKETCTVCGLTAYITTPMTGGIIIIILMKTAKRAAKSLKSQPAHSRAQERLPAQTAGRREAFRFRLSAMITVKTPFSMSPPAPFPARVQTYARAAAP
jgi:hypothetical protein